MSDEDSKLIELLRRRQLAHAKIARDTAVEALTSDDWSSYEAFEEAKDAAVSINGLINRIKENPLADDAADPSNQPPHESASQATHGS